MFDMDESTPDTREQEPRFLWDPIGAVADRQTPLGMSLQPSAVPTAQDFP